MNDVVELARQLVAADSVNPSLADGAAGEAEAAGIVSAWCERAGLEVEVEDAAPGRPNVVARARGTGGGRSLLLNAHTDTVGVAGMERPFEPLLVSGRLYGRGAYDMKGALAATMVAAAEAARRRLRGDVVVAAVIDEEAGSLGTEALVRGLQVNAAIVAEPTELRVCTAHRGFVGFEIEVDGRAAHGSRRDLGVDAIARMGHVLVRLESLDRSLEAGARHPLLGTGSIHASLIEGGQEYSSYPARCRLTGERRTVPGDAEAGVGAELLSLLGDLDGETRLLWSRPPLETDRAEPIVQAALRHSADRAVGGLPFWADSALLSRAGIPTILFGPAGEGAHAEVEWVEVASLERCVEFYLAVAEEFCS